MSLANGANDESRKPLLVTSCRLSRLSSDTAFTVKPSLILPSPLFPVSLEYVSDLELALIPFCCAFQLIACLSVCTPKL